MFFFFNDTATTEIYTLSLHDALPILLRSLSALGSSQVVGLQLSRLLRSFVGLGWARRMEELAGTGRRASRSEEHTSELQSRQYLVCRLLLEKKNNYHPVLASTRSQSH